MVSSSSSSMIMRTGVLLGGGVVVGCTFAMAGGPVQTNDVIFGLSNGDGLLSIELVRGPAEEGGGAIQPDFWDEASMQSVELDNLDDILHNPRGNLLGVNFGSEKTGGTIFNLATCSEDGADQLIGDTIGLGGDGITLTRLGGLSVSLENTKIAVVGYDTGQVIVYDYLPGDCNGTGAVLSEGRETDTQPLFAEDTQGTAWLDDDTLIAFSTTGEIFEIDADSMESEQVAVVNTIEGGGPGFTDIEYNPEVSENIYAFYSAFTGETLNLLFVLDTKYNLLGTFDYSESMNTSREIAFDSNGNLYVTQFSALIDFIPNAAEVGDIEDNVSVDWYASKTFSAFNGLDIAHGEPAPDCPEDLDGSGDVGFSDLVRLLTAWGACEGDCPEDLDNSGDVGFADLVRLLAAWGPC